MRDQQQNFHPKSIALPSMHGYQASCLQDGGHSTQKENTLSKCSKQDFISLTLLIIVGLISDTFHLVELDSSIWFRYQLIVSAY